MPIKKTSSVSTCDIPVFVTKEKNKSTPSLVSGVYLKILYRKSKKTKKSGGSPKPKNPALYSRVKAEAKKKFKVYPSAYANAWLVKTYKKRGGKY